MRLTAALLLALPALSQPPAPAHDTFAPLRFLVGEWVGEGSGAPGEGQGAFSLQPDLGGKVLVRRNRTDFPAAQGRPATRHEDLMWIFPEGGVLKAVYLDTEDHLIRYTVSAGPQGEAVFTSDPAPGPRFRLSYRRAESGKVAIRFEIALPGKDFATYLEGKVAKKP